MRIDNEERDDNIYIDYQNNVPIREIAERNALSGARINQIIYKYQSSKKLADRAHKRMHHQEEEIVATVSSNRALKTTPISIEGYGLLTLRASIKDIVDTLKDKFSTNLEKLQDLISSGEISEKQAGMILESIKNWDSVGKEKNPKRVITPQYEDASQPYKKSESELANEEDPDDRMQGIDFGRN